MTADVAEPVFTHGNVTVTNNAKEAYERKFDGKLYVFPPKEPVTISAQAAAFLFAYGLDESAKQRLLIRNGWLKNGLKSDPHGPVAAADRLKAFAFKRAPNPKRAVPEKKILRTLTGVNAIVEKNDVGRGAMPPRDVLRIPGSTGPLAPPAP